MFIETFRTVLAALRSAVVSLAALLAENAVLRQQLVVLRRSSQAPFVVVNASPWPTPWSTTA